MHRLMRLIRRDSPVIRRTRSALAVIARLEARGCNVLSAHAHAEGLPVVHVAAPPPGVFATFATAQLDDLGPMCSARCGEVLVTWPACPVKPRQRPQTAWRPS